ncbi:hypothetical protein MMC21_003248, partial [Puttea exsequens]|nr:hypothetical protein [Puttea exsequens]
GAQGLGLATARALLEHSLTHLAILDFDTSALAAALDHLRAVSSHDVEIIARIVDVSDEASVDEAVSSVAEAFAGLDVLVCFAGISGSEAAVEYDIARWKRIFDVNLHGSFLVARAFARDVIARETAGASIVLTASMSGYIVNTPQPHAAYAVSKAGVHHLARSLAGEWVGRGIRVNSVSPGIMNTRLSGGERQEGLRARWLERCPLGIGEPEDLVGAVVLLCGGAGRFITGADLKVDGGYTIF